MKNKEFREIQISSSLLVFIFLGVLALGVFVFLLGVSVGKKQAEIAGTSTAVAEKKGPSEAVRTVNPLAGEIASPPKKEETAGLPDPQKKEEQAAPSSRIEEATKTKGEEIKPPPVEPKTSTAQGTDNYFVQVGAFSEKASAVSIAEQFRVQGYPAVVIADLLPDRKPVFKVRLGGFGSREKAADVLAKLNAASAKKTGYYIVKE